MKPKPDKTETLPNKKSRFRTILSSFAIFFIAIALVTVLAWHNNKVTAPARHSQPARVAMVRITSSGFQPSTLKVAPGTRVVWTNSDNTLHQIASNPFPKDNGLPGLKSEILNNTQSYSYIANATGTFGYHDQLTPTINGTLVVSKR